MHKQFLSILLFTSLFGISGFAKDRVLILTDISNEPDDKQSMVRLMLYSNEIELEGLVATTSCWLKANPRPEQIEEVVDAYSLVRDNLLLHASGYPTAEYLRGLIKQGNTGYSMGDVGEGKTSEGAQHIISVVDKDDPRPVWICIWGGANTLAQALWEVQNSRTTVELDTFISKIRIYDLGGQDDSGAWMTHTFPYLYFIRSQEQWHGISYRIDGAWPESRGGDESVFSPEWVYENLQLNHGPLGAIYPDAAYLHEGDTPTFLNMLPNGLSDPHEPAWGGWGGRFLIEPQMNPLASQPPVVNEDEYQDFWMITEAQDHWQWQDQVYDNSYCAVFRWRVDFQNDFAARMDWCLQSFENANHNPVIILNGDSTRNVLVQHVNPGDQILLEATQTYDPDDDSLSYTWWIYPEAGTYSGEIVLTVSDSSSLDFDIPTDAAGTSIHCILTVQDNGEPSLFAYRRVVFYVQPYTEFVDLIAPNILDAPESHFIDYRTQVSISLITDERAFLKFDFSDKTYKDMAHNFSEGQGGIQHLAFIQAEQGQDVTVYVQAKDLAGNEMSNSVMVHFTVDTMQTPVNWKDIRYPDKWQKGPAPVGTGYDDLQTTLSNVNTVYLRKKFSVDHIETVEQVKIRTYFEDGIAIYVNGQEIQRFYLPQGDVGYDSTATRSNDPSRAKSVFIRNDDLALLVSGENQIAVEVHQANDDENDLSFDAELSINGETVQPYGSEWYYFDTGEEPSAITLENILSNVSQNLLPAETILMQNYPNPFNPETTIKYCLKYSDHVLLTIYNLNGQVVETLVDRHQPAGRHQVVWQPKGLANGTYIYRIKTGDLSDTRQLIILK